MCTGIQWLHAALLNCTIILLSWYTYIRQPKNDISMDALHDSIHACMQSIKSLSLLARRAGTNSVGVTRYCNALRTFFQQKVI